MGSAVLLRSGSFRGAPFPFELCCVVCCVGGGLSVRRGMGRTLTVSSDSAALTAITGLFGDEQRSLCVCLSGLMLSLPV